jgi:hypothetical protein
LVLVFVLVAPVTGSVVVVDVLVVFETDGSAGGVIASVGAVVVVDVVALVGVPIASVVGAVVVVVCWVMPGAGCAMAATGRSTAAAVTIIRVRIELSSCSYCLRWAFNAQI